MHKKILSDLQKIDVFPKLPVKIEDYIIQIGFKRSIGIGVVKSGTNTQNLPVVIYMCG